VTNTLAVPATLAAMVAVIVVEFTTVKLLAKTPPIIIAVAPVKFAPVIVMEVPPNVDPLDGETLATVGAGIT
jgi:hypothetical protein